MSSVKKSFKSVKLTAEASPVSIPDNQIMNITNYSKSNDIITISDNDTGDEIEVQIGETITLNWGFVNCGIKIEVPTGATGRVIYYR